MLLRSSSTPILGSLLSSSSTPHFSESPNNNHHHHHHQIFEKTHHHHFNPTLPSFSCHLSPLSDSSDRDPSAAIIRRAQSDGNLHSLLSSDRRTNPFLDTIPSFSIYNSKEEEEEEEEQLEEEEEEQLEEEEKDGIGKGIKGEFSFLGDNQNLNLVENSEESGVARGSAAVPLFLARGLGIDRLGSGFMNAGGNCGGGGGGGGGGYSVKTGNGGDRSDIEMYYKRMVEENPSNALFLRNYAQFLYQSKGDPQRAEEYYSRTILAEPRDGEILSQYAKLVWELHHDRERASSYFEQAVRAAPGDSHVLGAYAGFLWETEDDDGIGGGEGDQSQDYFEAPVHHGVLASART